jgi:hypothetical protein
MVLEEKRIDGDPDNRKCQIRGGFRSHSGVRVFTKRAVISRIACVQS